MPERYRKSSLRNEQPDTGVDQTVARENAAQRAADDRLDKARADLVRASITFGGSQPCTSERAAAAQHASACKLNYKGALKTHCRRDRLRAMTNAFTSIEHYVDGAVSDLHRPPEVIEVVSEALWDVAQFAAELRGIWRSR